MNHNKGVSNYDPNKHFINWRLNKLLGKKCNEIKIFLSISSFAKFDNYKPRPYEFEF